MFVSRLTGREVHLLPVCYN